MTLVEELIANLAKAIEEFIKAAPDFPGDDELAENVGKALGKLEGHIANQ